MSRFTTIFPSEAVSGRYRQLSLAPDNKGCPLMTIAMCAGRLGLRISTAIANVDRHLQLKPFCDRQFIAGDLSTTMAKLVFNQSNEP